MKAGARIWIVGLTALLAAMVAVAAAAASPTQATSLRSAGATRAATITTRSSRYGGGEQVVLGARGPNIGPAEEPLAQIFNVFTLREGRIVRIDDYRGRREALAAAGVAEDADWR